MTIITTQTYKIGNCLQLLPEIPRKSIDFIITDPPYGMNYQSGWYLSGNPFKPIDNDKTFNQEFNNCWLKECYEILKDNTSIMIFTSYQVINDWIPLIEKYFTLKNIIVWIKNNWTAGDLTGNFGNQYELIMFATKGNFKLKEYRYSNVWNFDREKPNGHPTIKPVAIIERALEVCTEEGNIVCDPFLGSGSSLDACIKTNRNFMGFEINSEYEKIIKSRIQLNCTSKSLFEF